MRFPAGTDKVPHMGWNSVRFRTGTPMGTGEPKEEFYYFVHSFYVPLHPEWTAAECEYILPFSAAIGSGHWFATQFHPEKRSADRAVQSGGIP